MTCHACDQAKANPNCGSYHFDCKHCCARLVAHARGSRREQEKHLAAIARNEWAPTREEILQALKSV